VYNETVNTYLGYANRRYSRHAHGALNARGSTRDKYRRFVIRADNK